MRGFKNGFLCSNLVLKLWIRVNVGARHAVPAARHSSTFNCFFNTLMPCPTSLGLVHLPTLTIILFLLPIRLTFRTYVL